LTRQAHLNAEQNSAGSAIGHGLALIQAGAEIAGGVPLITAVLRRLLRLRPVVQELVAPFRRLVWEQWLVGWPSLRMELLLAQIHSKTSSVEHSRGCSSIKPGSQGGP
jgi:hypothetical protein